MFLAQKISKYKSGFPLQFGYRNFLHKIIVSTMFLEYEKTQIVI